MLIVLSGLASAAGGIFLVLVRDDADVLRETGETSDILLAVGIIAIIIGLIYLAVASGLAHGNGFARFLVALVSVLNLVGGVYLAFAREGQLQVQGIISAVIALIVLLLLYSPPANAFFRTN